ncbi:DNA-binding Xre family transcriptional regulator [Hymenobacter sp. UYAg731]
METPQITVNERIKILVNAVSRKTGDFLKATGLSSQNLSDLTTGKKGAPSFATITKILSAYPDLNERWLLMGEGEMLKGQQPEGAGLNHTAALLTESDAILKLAVTEAKLEAANKQVASLNQMLEWVKSLIPAALAKLLSSPDAAYQGQPFGAVAYGG